MTVHEVYEELLKERYSKERYTKSRYRREVEMNWRNHLLPTFGGIEISKVSPPDVFNWHTKFEKNPVAGNRAKTVLSTIFTFAQLKGHLSIGYNPCPLVPSHRERPRRRFASESEIIKIREILARDSASRTREVLFISLLIFSGSRPSAIERACHKDVTRRPNGSGILSIEGKKGPEDIFLPIQAMALIHDGKPSDSLAGRFPRRYWQKVRKEAGCEDLWARDWRRTFATTALSNGVPIGVVGELLNHKGDMKVTGRYAKLTTGARSEAVETISNILGGKAR